MPWLAYPDQGEWW